MLLARCFALATLGVSTTALLVTGGPGYAQPQAQGQSAAKSLTNPELNLMLAAAAFTACDLSNNKTSWDLSVVAPSRAITILVTQLYKGVLPGVASPMKPEEMFKVISSDIALRTYSMCPKLIPDAEKAQLQKVLDARRSASK